MENGNHVQIRESLGNESNIIQKGFWGETCQILKTQYICSNTKENVWKNFHQAWTISIKLVWNKSGKKEKKKENRIKFPEPDSTKVRIPETLKYKIAELCTVVWSLVLKSAMAPEQWKVTSVA